MTNTAVVMSTGVNFIVLALVIGFTYPLRKRTEDLSELLENEHKLIICISNRLQRLEKDWRRL